MNRIFKIFTSLSEAFARMREVRQRGAKPQLKILENENKIIYFVFNHGLKVLIIFGAIYYIIFS